MLSHVQIYLKSYLNLQQSTWDLVKLMHRKVSSIIFNRSVGKGQNVTYYPT